jgi:hypothetical protein
MPTSSSAPFSIKIFVADGDPDGLRLVERSNWTGKGVIFPRALYTKVRTRNEFEQTGVYLLIGPRETGDGDQIYIGEGDPVRPRLENHYAKKDFWTKAVFFVAGQAQLNKAHVQYLEAQLIERATSAKRAQLENGNTPTEPTLSEADRADMDVFLSNLVGMLPALGIHAFEQASSKVDGRSPLLTCQRKTLKATGRDTAKGFLVLSGSHAAKKHTSALKQHFPAYSEMRYQLITNGVLTKDGDMLRFTQDYTFNSPSMASSVILGRASNGRTEWKDADDKTLKAIQEAQASKLTKQQVH